MEKLGFCTFVNSKMTTLFKKDKNSKLKPGFIVTTTVTAVAVIVPVNQKNSLSDHRDHMEAMLSASLMINNLETILPQPF